LRLNTTSESKYQTFMKKTIFVLTLLLFSVKIFAQEKLRTVHVMVALCDNKYQGIAKVPAKIGNGQSTYNNLYWGALYGLKTRFKKNPDWQLVESQTSNLPDHVLERVIFRHSTKNTYLIADAYDGAHIRQTTMDFIYASGGYNGKILKKDNRLIPAYGAADLLVYIGHNGLMDFHYAEAGTLLPRNDKHREIIMLGCITKDYFTNIMLPLGVTPLLWSTHLMAPESYTLEAALKGWVNQESSHAISERAAQAYHRYQKCGINSARRLLVSGY